MSRNPLIPAKPAEITFDTLPQLFAHHRAVFSGWSMDAGDGGGSGDGGNGGQGDDQPPERPSDLPEDEWNALGDPGKRAIVRERQRAEAAERALAAARARPAPPKPPAKTEPDDKGKGGGDQPPAKPKDGELDIEAIVNRAVEAATKPFRDAEERRQTEDAANKVRDAVLEAAKPRLHDNTDALANIDLASIVDDQGKADADKVKNALDDLVKRKPHLAKTTERIAPPGIGGGAPAGATEAEKVKAALADMQRAAGVRIPSSNSN